MSILGEPVKDGGECYDAWTGREELLCELDEDVGRVDGKANVGLCFCIEPALFG